jgi:hypothetical protein
MIFRYSASQAALRVVVRMFPVELSAGRTTDNYHNPILEWLPEHLEDMTPALRAFVQEAHARVRPRHLARPRDLAAADQPHSRDGMRRGATWPAGDQGRAPIGQAGDAMDPGGVEGCGHAHLRQDGGQAAGQPRCPRARRTQEKDVGVRTPALLSGLPELPGMPTAIPIDSLSKREQRRGAAS